MPAAAGEWPGLPHPLVAGGRVPTTRRLGSLFRGLEKFTATTSNVLREEDGEVVVSPFAERLKLVSRQRDAQP